MNCCSPQISETEEKRRKEEDAQMERVFEINGVKLKVKDMFTDHWAAKDFLSKLNLLEKTVGGKALMDTSPASIMDEDGEEE